tara:strand:- start:193 stop:489 length:297 start_codon:yes stop_codon:yes gene_type:complete
MVKRNFTRKDLTDNIFKKIGFSKNFSSKITDNFFDTLVNHIIKFHKVKISSFGTFEVIKKKERIGRNPKTRVEARISPRKIVKFKPSLIFKNKINHNE